MATQIGNALNALSQPASNPAVQIENSAVLGVHDVLEELGHDTNLSATTHGLTNTGETFGLGKVGGNNLLTDTAQASGDILNGANPQTVVSNIITDAGQTVGSSGGLIQGIGSDLANPNLVQDVVNGTGEFLGGGSSNGADGSHIISANAGPGGGSPIANLGVLTTSDSGSPVSVDVGNGQNIANISALSGANDTLRFPDLGGGGSDALVGIVPNLGNALSVADGPAREPAFLQIGEPQADFVQIHDNPHSLLEIGTHPVV